MRRIIKRTVTTVTTVTTITWSDEDPAAEPEVPPGSSAVSDLPDNEHPAAESVPQDPGSE
ncbi:MAG: hypothetical protein H0T53_17790 [Herpetosiphonaceae bacterium]|nr:hypothetical protein [Herpetosiphonaceae bacterium]